MSMRAWWIAALAALLLSLSCAMETGASAQDALPGQAGPRAAPTVKVEVQSLPQMDSTPQFDADKATDKYLARVAGPARAKSDAYFEGGYWLQLCDLLYGLAVAGVLLWSGFSVRLRDWAGDRTRSRTAQVLIYVAAYTLIVAAASFPLTLYEGFFREHAYDLSNQSFPAWFGDFGIGLAISLVASLIVIPIIYAIIRAARENWWIWGAGVFVFFLVIELTIYPVFIAPLFNHYAPLPDSPIKKEILAMARANDIPADNVWTFDASRQSNRISANVSGFLGTTRISLNDNLLKQGTHDEVLAVLGHEMGHYVMGHVTRGLLLMGLLVIAVFAFVHFGFRIATDLFGGQWQVRRLDDIAGLPLLAALSSLFFFFATPVSNTITRTMEHQADIFGVNAVRKPDAFATVALKLSTYRKLDPAPLEEIIFFDHPSGRSRIHSMMEWKAAHIGDADMRGTENIP
jgi:STE24 endopeptidase